MADVEDKKANGAVENREEDEDETSDEHPDDPYFEPLVNLPEIDLKTLEEDEEILWKHRGQLYRFDDSEQPAQWKQRGTGVMKLLKHKKVGYVRLLMRRDVTLKVCANHYILPKMELRQHDKSDRTWVWYTPADFADEVAKPERLAIRFKDMEIFHDFHKHIETAKSIMREYQEKYLGVKMNEQGDVVAREDDDQNKNLVKEVEALSVN